MVSQDYKNENRTKRTQLLIPIIHKNEQQENHFPNPK